jgi:hypothetical protein
VKTPSPMPTTASEAVVVSVFGRVEL